MTFRTLQSVVRNVFVIVVISALGAACPSDAQTPSSVRYDQQNRVFRIDAGGMTYAFGVNEKSELQSIYWGGRLGENDPLPAAKSERELASFDSSATTTLQEFGGWGGGIYVEPALKVTFPDGNRDLVLHYVSHTMSKDGFVVTLKDILRDVFVELHYSVDEATGVLGRSAVIVNRTKEPLTIEK